MANPLGALGSIPIMDVIQGTLQRSANLRNSQILGDERQQLMQIRAQEMAERQATMKALQQDLQGGLQAQIDKSDIPSDDDTPIGLAQKNVRMLQQQFATANQRALSIANAGGMPEVAMQYQKEAEAIQARLIAANREYRLEQHNQAKAIGEAASSISPDGSNFDHVFVDLKSQDPRIARKYAWDRDVNDNPVWGDITRRTLNTIAQSSMTAKDQIEEQRKAQKEVDDAQERQLRMQKEKVEQKKLDAEAAIAQVNARRATEGKPLLGRETERERTDVSTSATKSADRLKAIADRAPTKDAVNSARSLIRGEYGGAEFDDTLDSFAQAVAAKTNEIRAKAARSGQDMELDEARSQALDALKPFVTQTTHGGTDLPIIGHVGGSKQLSFRRSGTPITVPEKPLALPATKNDLVTGKVYNTSRGPATWDGEKFTAIQ